MNHYGVARRTSKWPLPRLCFAFRRDRVNVAAHLVRELVAARGPPAAGLHETVIALAALHLGGRHGRRGDSRHRRLDDRQANAEQLEERIVDRHGQSPQPPPAWPPFAASSLRYSATGMPPQPQFSISTSWKTTQVHSGGFLSTSHRTWLTPL